MTERKVFSATFVRCPKHGRINLVIMRDDDHAMLCAVCRARTRSTQQSSLRAARFTIDGFDEVFVGFTDDANWNGWAVPYFSHAEGARLCRLLAQPSMRDAEDTVVAHYDEARDAFVTASGYEEDPEDVWGVVVREGTPLYSIGGMSWTWMEVPWEDTPRAFDLGDEVRA